jgi:hypothetical protein
VITDLAIPGAGPDPLALELIGEPALRPTHLFVAAEADQVTPRLKAAGARLLPHPIRPRDLLEAARDLLGTPA